MHIRAYAKINLGLRILGKRVDGFHDIETVFHQIDNCDEIELKRGTNGDITLTSNRSDIPLDETNLCKRAALLLRREHGIREGVQINLEKNVPPGGGLGGGSTDAAAVLKGLSALWHLDLTRDQLISYAAQLGSDVPFFLLGGSAFASGRGEILKPIELSIPYWIVVVTPPVQVSTAWAYANIEIKRDRDNGLLFEAVSNLPHQHELLSTIVQNDFEPLVCRTHPMVEELRSLFLRAGAFIVSLSGSGSSMFGMFEDGATAYSFASEFRHPYTASLTAPFFKPESEHFVIKH
ncbi:MAG: 4-(cytidine 5'-diphospho)-2-C-methyl-D-erythritol kinase [Ignavibacteria bacterium]|nr:4-(cytidine 5'-diphospho)-2-C-methyl-D-erythritol kinase [Ignavibacteria bacterium]